MQSHGRIEECILYAEASENYETVIIHYLNKQEFIIALQKIKDIKDTSKRHKAMLKYASVLIKKIPAETIHFLKSTSFKGIALKDLVPAFMGVDKTHLEVAFEYISGYCIEQLHSKETTVNNLRFFYLVEREKPEELLKFLK